MKIIAFLLFTTFGIISLIESQKKEEKINELMDIAKKEFLNDSENDYSLMHEESETDLESNKEITVPIIVRSNSNISEISNNNHNSISFGLISAIFCALCISDFGDKSQIAVVTMAAIYNIYGILLGSTIALIGTITLAVLFGRWISEIISPNKLLLIGGLIFLAFGVETLLNIIY